MVEKVAVGFLHIASFSERPNTAIDFYVPSRDGSIVAVSLSEKGSEEGTLHLYETASGRKLGDLIPRVTYPTAGGDVAWNAEGTGFFYTRYPRGTSDHLRIATSTSRCIFTSLARPRRKMRTKLDEHFHALPK